MCKHTLPEATRTHDHGVIIIYETPGILRAYQVIYAGYFGRLYLQVISEGSKPGNNLFHVIHIFTHIAQDILSCIVPEDSTFSYVSPLIYFLLISFIIVLFCFSHSCTSTNSIYYSIPSGILESQD